MGSLRSLVLLGLVINLSINGLLAQTASPFESGDFRWSVSSPFLAVDPERLPRLDATSWLAIKDPSIVRHDGSWHLFCTLRNDIEGEGRIRIGYVSFQEWAQAGQADWHLLELTMGYHGAPQIFFFEPHGTWYLIYQAEDKTRDLKYGPCFSTNPDISDPSGWTLPEPLYVVKEGNKAGLDYWVICDESEAYLFFTTLDGRMWRAQTAIANFPGGPWTDPTVALTADIFEASHTYALRGRNQFLTVVEAQGEKRRYFKAFLSDSLDGDWQPLAATSQKPLVSPKNVVNQSDSWATSYSHGEFIRAGCNEKLEIDPDNLELVFQGANDREYQQHYGQVPWRLGRLKIQGP